MPKLTGSTQLETFCNKVGQVPGRGGGQACHPIDYINNKNLIKFVTLILDTIVVFQTKVD